MSGSSPSGRVKVAVVSELAMVAEVVRAGLAARDLLAICVKWPGSSQDAATGSRAGYAQDVGLLICPLDSWSRLRTARLLISRVPRPWVVLTETPYGPMWGAALEAGARVVLPSSTSLTAVRTILVGTAHGTADTVPDERELLLGLWAELQERREAIGERVESLTPREHEVLTMLHAGDPVARIAQLFEVSPTTVRSQVKAVLRKLEVNSQLGAVAALDDLLELHPHELQEQPV